MANRQHLYKAKREDNGEWVIGYLCKAGTKNGYVFAIQEMIGERGYIMHEVIPETVCEWTGLEDKNGKKVFEGDIVKTHYANTNKTEFVEQVIFEGGCFRAQAKYKDNSSHSAPLYDGTPHLAIDKSVYMDSVEVIGNIHDDSELLEV